MHATPARYTPLAIFSALVLCGLTLNPSSLSAAPALPGISRLFSAGSQGYSAQNQLLAGEVLTADLRCARCHAGVSTRLPSPDAPALDRVFDRVAPSYLREFLLSPATVKPGTAMPDVLATVPAPSRNQVADELVAFLQSRGGSLPLEDQNGDFLDRDDGEKLFHSVGCLACHGTLDGKPKVASDEVFVPLGALARKTTKAQLAAYLMNPALHHAGTRMPNFRLTKSEAMALSTYLLREQLPQSEAEARKLRTPGVRYEYFEGFVREGPPDWEKMKLVRRGVMPTLDLPSDVRGTKIALRFAGLIDIKAAGAYTFFSESNDGSELVIGKQVIVKNHGLHGRLEAAGKVDLQPGLHVIGVSFWQDEGSKSLKISWQGPGFAKQGIAASALFAIGSLPMQPVGFAVPAPDAAKATRGAVHFRKLGCANCHEKVAADTMAAPAIDFTKGCLAIVPSEKAPNFHLHQTQREAIGAYLKMSSSRRPPHDVATQALLALATHNCLACHERAGMGGPLPSVTALFGQTIDVDLGEEGRLPPSLTNVGEKLRPDAIQRIVSQGELHVRPYMATRMPSFALDLGQHLGTLLAKADRGSAYVPKAANTKTLHDGRRLLGTSPNPSLTGFGCVNCHSIAGNAGQGTPGPDLALSPARLNYRWFDRWLAAPQSIRPSTRMPGFWGDEPLLPDVAGGVAARQRAAIWAYLRHGATPLPEGVLVQSASQELKVGTEPVVYRTFMKNGGPRAIVVGNPESVHVAFDANVVRMAQAWRGRFWDPSGTWTGRAGAFNEPLGDHILSFPAGPAFARLPSKAAAWPQATIETRELGGRFLGYRLDSRRRPVFRYELEGVTIAEVVRPLVNAEGFGLVRSFSFDKPLSGFMYLAGEGRRIEKVSAVRYVVDGHVFLKLPAAFASSAIIRTADSSASSPQQLLVPMSQTARAFDLEVFWQ